jgi:hypothetical protein
VRDGPVRAMARHGLAWHGQGYRGVWVETCGGRRASGVRRRRRPAREGTARGSQGKVRKGRFGAIGSHRARTDGHWLVSACGPGGTAAARVRDMVRRRAQGRFPFRLTPL